MAVSWSEGHGFDSQQEWRESFLLPSQLSVLTLGICSTPVLLQHLWSFCQRLQLNTHALSGDYAVQIYRGIRVTSWHETHQGMFVQLSDWVCWTNWPTRVAMARMIWSLLLNQTMAHMILPLLLNQTMVCMIWPRLLNQTWHTWSDPCY